MRLLWCWRCQMDIPMLDEDEFAEIADLYARPHSEAASSSRDPTSLWEPMLDRYEEMTGFRETNPNAIMHHRLAMYGLPSDC